MMTVKMYFIRTSKGSHIGTVKDLYTAMSVLIIILCFCVFSILCISILYKPEMPCDMNHLQVSKSNILNMTPSIHGIFPRALSSVGFSQRAWKKAPRKSVL